MSLADAEAHQARHFGTTLTVDAPKAPEPVKVPKPRQAKQPNKTESEFGTILQSRVIRGEFTGPPRFEAVKLRIAGNCYYAPDWMVRTIMGRPVFFEVKGAHIWDDSKVKYKAAAELHDWADFQMWQKSREGWRQIA